MDEKTLDQQTDESGDLFMWLKHQAQQGVASAQVRLHLSALRSEVSLYIARPYLHTGKTVPLCLFT